MSDKYYLINNSQISSTNVDTKPIIEELLQQTIDIENELNEIKGK